MRRGEVWWIEFEPAVGSEIRKTRPAVIVSNDAANRHLARLAENLPPEGSVRCLTRCAASPAVQGGEG